MTKKITRQTHIIDASNIALGRLATDIARLLTGKHKVTYTPNQDQGDFVVVNHFEKVKLTGKKLEQRVYYRHSGYQGGLKEKKMKTLMRENPAEVLRKAVYQMLPKNKTRDVFIKRLTIK